MRFTQKQRFSSWPSVGRLLLLAGSLFFCFITGLGSVTAQTDDDHGNDFNNATNLPLGSSIAGRISPGDDLDVFRLDLSGTSGTTDVWIYTTGDLDTQGWLYDSSGDLLASNDNTTSGGVIVETNFRIPRTLTPGVYYVRVYSADRTTTGDYTLHAKADDHGHSSSVATSLSLGFSVVGSIDPDFDRDVFKLDLSGTPGTTDVWIYTTGDLDTLGWLYDSNINLIASNDDSYIAGRETSFSLRSNLSSGVYYLWVRSWDGAIGDYTLHAEAVTDPGSATGTAATLSLDSPAPGMIDTASDADYFRLVLTESKNLVIYTYGLVLHDGSNFSPIEPLDGAVLDNSGAEISVNVYDEGIGFNIMDDFNPGTYYVKVTAPASDTTYPVPYTIHAYEDANYTDFIGGCEAATVSLNNPQISDPLYGCQWHLRNQEQVGEDINVEPVWAEGINGEGVNVAVVDDTMDYSHEDLAGNINSSLNHDYGGMGGAYRPFDHHGTAVAGIIAARDNGFGVRGVAPRATIFGYNYLAGNWGGLLQDRHRMNAMSRNQVVTAVSNNSWGPPDGPGLDDVSMSWEMAVDSGIREGYDGKGVFYAWAGGNGGGSHLENPDGTPVGGHFVNLRGREDNSNYDEFANYHAVTAVCAVNDQDTRSVYSEKGANLWVCAPSSGDSDQGHRGIVTTENSDRYQDHFGGTSAATPIVSGVAALLRDANPDLSWRDLKLILAASARKNDAANPDWAEGARKYGSGSAADRYHFNHGYGFGVVDAKAAVDLARGWTNVPTLESVSASSEAAVTIPPPSGSAPQTVTTTLTLNTGIRFTEFVEINTDFDHTSFRDMEIELVSPSGAVSKLAVPFNTRHYHTDELFIHPTLGEIPRTFYVWLDGEFRFGSARHLGEDPNGVWTLRLTDHFPVLGGTLRSWSIKVYGHASDESAASSDATLSGLTVSPVNIVGFASNVTEYHVGVANSVTQASITATASDADATIDVNGSVVSIGSPHAVSLTEGRNEVTITVTASDEETVETYTVVIGRGVTTAYGWKATDDFNTLVAGNNYPSGLWSDGTTMWVANYNNAPVSKIFAYDLSTKARDESKDFNTLSVRGSGTVSGNSYPTGIWSDGTTMWVADGADAKIYAYNLSTKARDAAKDFDTLSAAGNNSPRGIWSDGETMWVVDHTNHDDKVFAYDLATKERDASKEIDTLRSDGNRRAFGIWSDGTTVWVGDSLFLKLYAYDLATKSRDTSQDFSALHPTLDYVTLGIWSDGATMWVTDLSDRKIYSYNMPADTGTPATMRANRSFSPTSVDAGGVVEVTITAAGYGASARVVETLPAGFDYLSSSLSDSAVTVAGQEVSFILFGETSFTYTVTAPGAAGSHSFSGVLRSFDGGEVPLGGALTITVGSPPSVSVSRAAGSADTRVRPGSPISLTATFSRPVSGFTVDDITVANGAVGNFGGSGAVYTFDVTPSDIGEVTVDVAAGVARDAGGSGNTAAVQLSLGITYDDDGDGAISRDEVLAAITDYFADRITRDEVLGVITLYFSTPLVDTPGSPTGLTASGNGQTQIDLRWTAPTRDGGAAVTGYRIEVSEDRTIWNDLEPDTGSTATAYSHAGLTAGTTRHYRVSAINSAGTGSASNIATGTTDTSSGNQAPDLVVDPPSVSDSTPDAGAAFTLSATVRNQGDGLSGITALHYYRSTDSTITAADTQVGTDDLVFHLEASESSDKWTDLTAPSVPGTYYYGACVDAVRDESDTTNNCSTAVTVTVQAPAGNPDLVVESPSVSDSSPDAGATFTLSVTVRNHGDGSSASTTLRYYRSTDATITSADMPVGTAPVSGLSASGTSPESIGLTAPSEADTYYYGACVDSVSGESTTANNCSSAVAVTVGVVTAGDYDADNDGLIEVSNLTQLNAIRWDLDGDGESRNSGYTQAFPGAVAGMGCPDGGCSGYELISDLDFDTNGNGQLDAGDSYWNGGAGWEPISGFGFEATFDGADHTIANLYINRSTESSVGLFGSTDSDSVIRKVGLVSASVKGNNEVGSLVGDHRGKIDNSHASGSVDGNRKVGGLVGSVWGSTIENSYTTNSVTGTGNEVGGLVGDSFSSGIIVDSHATGNVTGNSDVGGLIGSNWSVTVRNSYATGSVTGTSRNIGGLVGGTFASVTVADSYATGSVIGTNQVGGLVGAGSGANVSNSYSTGDVTGTNQVGGLVGGGSGANVSNSYSTGDVTGTGEVGGLIGSTSGTIAGSYATGTVTATGNEVGGLVGRIWGASITGSYATGNVTTVGNEIGGLVGGSFSSGTITASYATGSVNGNREVAGFLGSSRGVTIRNSYAIGAVSGNDDVGGLVGDKFGSGNNVISSYWDTQSTGQLSSVGGTGQSTSQLQSPTSNTGIYADWNADWWDFGTSSQYPALKYSDLSVADQRNTEVAAAAGPDLAVGTPTVTDISPTAGASFTLRNQGSGSTASTTLRYYRSTDSSISSSDTAVGTDSVSGLSASGDQPCNKFTVLVSISNYC